MFSRFSLILLSLYLVLSSLPFPLLFYIYFLIKYLSILPQNSNSIYSLRLHRSVGSIYDSEISGNSGFFFFSRVFCSNSYFIFILHSFLFLFYLCSFFFFQGQFWLITLLLPSSPPRLFLPFFPFHFLLFLILFIHLIIFRFKNNYGKLGGAVRFLHLSYFLILFPLFHLASSLFSLLSHSFFSPGF